MKRYINITKNPSFYKHKGFKHTTTYKEEPSPRAWFEVVYFTNYGTNHQSIVCKKFDTEKEADKFCKMKINLIK